MVSQGNEIHEERTNSSLSFLPQGVSWASRQGTISIAMLGGRVWLCPWQGLPVPCALCLCTPLCPGGHPAALEE